jgi:DNA invertase Pin-like site-specific DNA recombinase
VSKRSNEDTHTTPPNPIFGGSKPGNWGVQIGNHTDIAIYLRVSTEEQNVENQLPIIETYLRANFPKFDSKNPFADGCRGFHLFWDHESGKHTDRKAWGLLFNRMQSKKYKHIICWHVDRVSRNIEDFARILRYARAADCTFHFASLHLRSDSPMMEFMCKFFALWGEHEVALREMRQKEGIKRRRDAGLHMGRKPDMTRDVEVFELLRKEPNISIAAVARHFNKGRDWARAAMKRVSERSPPHDE